MGTNLFDNLMFKYIKIAAEANGANVKKNDTSKEALETWLGNARTAITQFAFDSKIEIIPFVNRTIEETANMFGISKDELIKKLIDKFGDFSYLPEEARYKVYTFISLMGMEPNKPKTSNVYVDPSGQTGKENVGTPEKNKSSTDPASTQTSNSNVEEKGTPTEGVGVLDGPKEPDQSNKDMSQSKPEITEERAPEYAEKLFEVIIDLVLDSNGATIDNSKIYNIIKDFMDKIHATDKFFNVFLNTFYEKAMVFAERMGGENIDIEKEFFDAITKSLSFISYYIPDNLKETAKNFVDNLESIKHKGYENLSKEINEKEYYHMGEALGQDILNILRDSDNPIQDVKDIIVDTYSKMATDSKIKEEYLLKFIHGLSSIIKRIPNIKYMGDITEALESLQGNSVIPPEHLAILKQYLKANTKEMGKDETQGQGENEDKKHRIDKVDINTIKDSDIELIKNNLDMIVSYFLDSGKSDYLYRELGNSDKFEVIANGIINNLIEGGYISKLQDFCFKNNINVQNILLKTLTKTKSKDILNSINVLLDQNAKINENEAKNIGKYNLRDLSHAKINDSFYESYVKQLYGTIGSEALSDIAYEKGIYPFFRALQEIKKNNIEGIKKYIESNKLGFESILRLIPEVEDKKTYDKLKSIFDEEKAKDISTVRKIIYLLKINYLKGLRSLKVDANLLNSIAYDIYKYASEDAIKILESKGLKGATMQNKDTNNKDFVVNSFIDLKMRILNLDKIAKRIGPKIEDESEYPAELAQMGLDAADEGYQEDAEEMPEDQDQVKDEKIYEEQQEGNNSEDEEYNELQKMQKDLKQELSGTDYDEVFDEESDLKEIEEDEGKNNETPEDYYIANELIEENAEEREMEGEGKNDLDKKDQNSSEADNVEQKKDESKDDLDTLSFF